MRSCDTNFMFLKAIDEREILIKNFSKKEEKNERKKQVSK